MELGIQYPRDVSEVAQSCQTLCNPVNCSLLGFSVHGILQARILEWVAISFCRGSSHPGIKPGSPALQADVLPSEPPGKPPIKMSVLLKMIYKLVQFSSVTQLCPTLCNPMNRSTPGLPVHHQLREFTETHGHRVGDAIQPSHPLSYPSPAPNPSQHQGPFQ